MNNKIILLQNAELEKNEMLHVKNQGLSIYGEKTAQNLTNVGLFDDVDIIICSTYKSSYLSAYPLAKKTNKNIIQMKEFDEINRNKEIQLTKEEYFNLSIKSFQDIDFTKYGWEPTRNGLERIVKGIGILQRHYCDKKILVVSHQIILNIYFAYLTDNIYNLVDRRNVSKPGNYGIINGNRVIKDIV